MSTRPSVLVVARAGDSEDVVTPIRGLAVQVEVVDGGAQTLAIFEALQPAAVVVCATLGQGDPRAVIAEVRKHPSLGSTPVVLIGDEHGPIRNALDAADFGVDRFVTRPVSPKALLFVLEGFLRSHEESSVQAQPSDHGIPQRSSTQTKLVARLDEAIGDFVSEAMGAMADVVPIDHARRTTDKPQSGEQLGREPTLILAQPKPGRSNLAGQALGASSAGPTKDAAATAPQVVTGDDKSDPLDDLKSVSQAREPGPEDSATVVRAQEPPVGPSDGTPFLGATSGNASEFATALRAKMSQMAADLSGDQAASISVEAAPSRSPSAGEHIAPRAHGSPRPQKSDAVTETFSLGEDSQQTVLSETATEIGWAAGAANRRGELSWPGADPATILAGLQREGASGKIVFRRDATEKVLFLEDGAIVFAESNLPHDRMGELLVREGKISRKQYQSARDMVAQSGRRMGEVLVEAGFLKRRELLPAVRRHIEDIGYSVFAWRNGEYAIVLAAALPTEKIKLARSGASILVEGIRRKYQRAELEELMGGARVRIIDSARAREVVKGLELVDDELAAVGRFDGRSVLSSVAQRSPADETWIYQLAFALILLNLAEYASQSGLTAPPDAPTSLVGETDLRIDKQRVEAKYAHVLEADYFTMLGVRRDASPFEIERAYQAARRNFSRSSFPNEVLQELAREIAEINEVIEEAYRILRNTEMRTSYLTNLHDA